MRTGLWRLRQAPRLLRWYLPRQRDALRDLLLGSVIGSPLWSRTTRPQLLRLAGVTIGPDCGFESRVTIRGASPLVLGRGCFVNTGAMLDCTSPITLGDDVHVGQGAKLLSVSHDLGPASRRAGALTSGPIVVGTGAWIGAGVIVLGGVTIGAGCVVAAGAVVTSDCEPNGLYAGLPATRRKDLPVPGEATGSQD